MNNVVLRINNIEDLDEVIEVGYEVFKPSLVEKEKYWKKSDWLIRMDNGLLISAVFDDRIIGFAFCYKRENDFHIWNVGVLNKYRKMGVWRKMYEEIIKFAKDNNYSEISLNTYKENFPEMYDFCKKEEFLENKTEFDTLLGRTKSMFSKKI